MFGLAAVAAVAAMAFIGASSASATFSTALCTEASGTLACPAGKLASSVHFVAKDPLLLTTLVNVLCKEALFSGTVENSGLLATAPEPLGISIGELKYIECETTTKIACTIKTEHLGLLDLLKTAADLGTLVDLPLGGSYTEVKVVCGSVINCTYKGENLTGHALSATATTTGHVTYSNSPVTKTGGILCPSESKLHALFESLTNLWLRS
jgi:hypothetical protein